MKKNYFYVALLALACAISTLVLTKKSEAKLSSLALANIEALSGKEDNTPVEEYCSVICLYDNCKKPNGDFAGLTILAVKWFKKESTVQNCYQFVVKECPFGSSPTGEASSTGHFRCDK